MNGPVADDVTRDTLLGGRVRLAQPKSGFRAAIDPVLLAAAVPAVAGERVFEAGSGTGAAALCLAARVPGVQVAGIEIDPVLAALANENARASGVADRVRFVAGDLFAPPPEFAGMPFAGTLFDRVMVNPPFLEAGSGSLSPDPGRRRATAEGAGGLAAWLDACFGFLAPGGTLTVIHRADRLDAVLAKLSEHAGGIIVFPLWPGEGKAAKRVIVAARKGSAAPLEIRPGLVLHRPGGGYTPEAEAILRGACALPMS
jgi:tRNA1(Val) A37 N6-methylase TrmN6